MNWVTAVEVYQARNEYECPGTTVGLHEPPSNWGSSFASPSVYPVMVTLPAVPPVRPGETTLYPGVFAP